MSDALVKVQGLSKKFCRDFKKSLWYGLTDLGNELRGRTHGGYGDLRPDEFWAVKDLSFEVRRGECVGLVGRNGAGKTTALRMLNGLVKPDQGRIEIHGRVGALIALGAGFNPILTGRENIYVNASVLGISKNETDRKFDDIIDFSGIGEFIDAPVQSYSSGMQVRLGFSVATAMEPDVLLLDEVLAVGDAAFRSKCLKRVGSILNQCAVIFVSHDAWSVRRICDSIIWLKHGSVAYQGDTETGMDLYGQEILDHDLPELSLTTAPFITNLTHEAKLAKFHKADDVEAVHIDVELAFDSAQSTNLGICHGNIITPDEVFIGQFDFTTRISEIKHGHNVIAFRVADIQLARGKYSMAIAMYDETNKTLLLNLRHFVDIVFETNTQYGPRFIVSTESIPNAG